MDRSSHSFGRLNSINHLSPFDVEIGKVHFTTFFSHITKISLWTAKTILHNINHRDDLKTKTIKPLQVGRVKTVASVSMILFFATVMTMVSDNEDSTNWMSRLAELSVGFALGLHLPSQQLMIAETAMPHQRYTTNSYSFLFRS